MDFATLAAQLLAKSRSLLLTWFPQGKLRGHEFLIGDLSGNPGESLSINVDTGKWADFSTGDKGGDLISLYAAVHNLTQGEAAKQLEESTGSSSPAPISRPEPKKRDVIQPAPESAPRCTCYHYEHGNASQVWRYLNAAGQLLGFVARYDPKGQRKQIVPWTFARAKDGKERWGMGHWPEPRPLYGLDDLAKRTAEPVMLVEGEKAADAARKIAPQYVVVTWPAGSQAWRKAGFEALAGRTVLLWPDADDPGIKCMWEIGHQLIKICPQVKIILPSDKTDGWDAADALKDGWNWDRLKEWAVPRAQLVTEGSYHEPRATAAAAGAGPAQSPADPDAGPRGVSDRQPGAGAGARQSDPGGRAKPRAADKPDANGTSQAVVTKKPVTPDEGRENQPNSQVGKWLAWNLDRTGQGMPVANLNNAVAVLEHDPTLQGLVWYDEFLQRLLTQYRRGDEVFEPREWTEADDINLSLYMQRTIGLQKIGREIVSQAVIAVAFRDMRNCVRDWLDSLVWDQEPRIEHFFEDHFGADGSAYTHAASRNFWLSIVARVYRPGCKVDNMIVLEGVQGLGKSRALQVIGGQWFTEQHESVTGRGFFEVLQGKLLVEIGEMDSFSRADITRVKQVVTCPSDRYRESYGRYAKDHPRQCVFVGTTNKDDWNKDETGARRFWPIACKGDIDYAAIVANREQLFAEAVSLFKSGARWWEMPDAETKAEQAKRYDADPWLEPISEYIGLRREICVNEILVDHLKIDIGKVGRPDQMRAAACLRSLGWFSRNERAGRTIRKVWRPAGE